MAGTNPVSDELNRRNHCWRCFSLARVMASRRPPWLIRLFELADLTVEQSAGDADHANNRIGADGGIKMFDGIAKGVISGVGNSI